jgi:hypothetical protein
VKRWLVAAFGIVVFLVAGSLVVGGKKKPKPRLEDLTSTVLIGDQAEAFVAQFAADHPSFRHSEEASATFWRAKGRTPLPHKVVQIKSKPKPPSRLGSILNHWFPRLDAQSYSDDQGTIILSRGRRPLNCGTGRGISTTQPTHQGTLPSPLTWNTRPTKTSTSTG